MQKPVLTSAEENKMGIEDAALTLVLLGKKKIKAASSADSIADSNGYIK